MSDDTDRHKFSPSEITAMRYAYQQLLGEYPERFPALKDKQELARSVVKSLEDIRSSPTKDLAEVVSLIMEEDGN